MENKLKHKNISSGPKLIKEIKTLWTTGIPQYLCQKLSKSMPSRIQAVLAAKGYATKYWKSVENILLTLKEKN